MELTAVLTPAEEGGYVALNPETGTTTQGETVEEAVASLQEATALYLAGAHVVARRGTKGCVIPMHDELKVGTLAGLLRQADVSHEDFIAAL
jgi:predicted RNase H-like HicB family nuclease